MPYDIKKDLKARYRVDLEFVLATGQKKYVLGSSQQLNKPSIRLFSIIAYFNTLITKSPNNVTIASLTSYTQAYLTLQDPASNNIIQQESLGLYIPNTEFKPPREFGGQQIDFTKSYFEFPSTTQPDADTGKAIVLTVEYWDTEL